MSSSQTQVERQYSTYLMQITRSGRPFVKDLHEMFSTLIISMPLEAHQDSSKCYENSFTTEEAIGNLGSLKLSRSHKQKDSSKVITTTTNTTFNMGKDTAKSMCQLFLDARLFENLSDPDSQLFNDNKVYGITPKGTDILERFISINNVQAPHLTKIFSSRPAKIRLFAVERNHETDSIVLSKQNVESVFRRFAGSKPNVASVDRNLGIGVKEYHFDNKKYLYTFSGAAACDWLCDFTTLITKEEAMRISSEFIRRGLIKPVNDKDCQKLKYSKSTYYRVLEKGRKVALWKYDIGGSTDLKPKTKSKRVKVKNAVTNGPGENERRCSVLHNNKESSIKKLQQILDDPNLCSLFMTFSKSILCEENLLFLLDVQNFKIKYNTNFNENDEKAREELIADAFRIYNTYLTPGAVPHELNIDFNLRQQMTRYMTSITSDSDQKTPITSNLYDKIQDVIYRLIAIDSVPKFIKTKEYLNYVQNNETTCKKE